MNKSTNTEQQVEPRPLIDTWGFLLSRHVRSPGHPRRSDSPISISVLLTNGCSKYGGTDFNDPIHKILRTILRHQVPVDICPNKATAQQRVDNALSSVQYFQ